MALYRTQAWNRYDDHRRGDFTSRYRAPAVMMWWRDRNLSLSPPPTAARAAATAPRSPAPLVGANVYVHSLGDPNQIQRFWDLGGGVYSDEPFPPRRDHSTATGAGRH